jgi:hypothetical protein
MKIIVTDLTRFNNQGLVCFAGIDPTTGACIRPFLTNVKARGDYLDFNSVKDHKIIPGSFLEGEFTKKPNPSRPHTEDHFVPQLSTSGNATSDEFMAVLEQTSSTTITQGFGSSPANKFYAVANPPAISIFTLKLTKPREQFALITDDQYGPAVFKAHITDASGFGLRYLKVTDLGFSDHVKSIEAKDPYLKDLNAFLQKQEVLYLRIGLGQAYAPQGDLTRRGYWLQLNGIYSFPNFRHDLRMYD